MAKTLVILAAGMGSRFGGLKQIEPVGPHKEIIADYSIYDALRAGFTKVIFVIKKEHLEYFQTNIIPKYQDKIKVEFVFQALEDIPKNIVIPQDRVKMWGTGQALLACQEKVNEPFVMINSDDFYGFSPYAIASKFLDNSTNEYEYLSVNYPYDLSKSANGKVNRGVVKIKDGYITDIDECSIYEEGIIVYAQNKQTLEVKEIDKNTPVSLNFFAFKPSIFKILEEEFLKFITSPLDKDKEFLLADIIKEQINKERIKFKAELAQSKWLGVTYKEDLEDFKKELLKLIEKGEYPEELWK